MGMIRTIALNKRIIHSHPNKIILITDYQAILKLYLIAESSNDTKLIRWLNMLKTLVENKIELLWRSSKNAELVCADYLSRFTNNNRHENVAIKFSNKAARITEEDMETKHIRIPDKMKLNDRLIKYDELVQTFRNLKGEDTQ